MNINDFQQLPVEEVARLVRDAGKKTCVFPLNGTRRWFVLEHGQETETKADFAAAYLEQTTKRNATLCRMLFAHGIDTMLIPVFSSYLMQRGEEYVHMAARGLSSIVNHPAFLQLYTDLNVRVRFYGDYETCFAGTPHAHIVDEFEQLMEDTKDNDGFRLFWGVCAQDATDAIVALTVKHYEEHGDLPDKETLIRQYYGEQMSVVNIYIGSGKPRAFDMPLITTGREDLYFSVTPSLALNQVQLRRILYDHLYMRPKEGASYDAMQMEDWQRLHQFYHANRDNVLGVGKKQKEWGLWHPLPQVSLDNL